MVRIENSPDKNNDVPSWFVGKDAGSEAERSGINMGKQANASGG